jgi:plastocyanin
MARLLMIGAAAIVLALGAVACGGDDDDEGEEGAATTAEEASAETVAVTAGEYSFDLSATPTAETTEVTFENAGGEDHNLIFARINEGFTLEDALEAEGRKGTAEEVGFTFAKPGKEGRPIEIKEPLEPGTYAMVCTVRTGGEPHYDLGMQTEFTIE